MKTSCNGQKEWAGRGGVAGQVWPDRCGRTDGAGRLLERCVDCREIWAKEADSADFGEISRQSALPANAPPRHPARQPPSARPTSAQPPSARTTYARPTAPRACSVDAFTLGRLPPAPARLMLLPSADCPRACSVDAFTLGRLPTARWGALTVEKFAQKRPFRPILGEFLDSRRVR